MKVCGGTYFPETASYKSVKGRLVGVSLTQLARSLKKVLRVSLEAMAAAKHCQSPFAQVWRVSRGTPYSSATVG